MEVNVPTNELASKMRDVEQRVPLNSIETPSGTETYRLVISKEVPNICALTNSAIFAHGWLMVQEEKKKKMEEGSELFKTVIKKSWRLGVAEYLLPVPQSVFGLR